MNSPNLGTPDILLTTLNARYIHSALGLRYLHANLKDLRSRAQIHEFTLGQNPRDLAEIILGLNPKMIGFSVYIWNATQTYELVSLLKRLSPKTVVVLGGPEVSFEIPENLQPLCRLADHTICGEGDFLFYDLCQAILAGRPSPQLISAQLPEIQKIEFPYALYTDEDIRNRVLYVEASRGCPYQCEYCLSSLDRSVRSFDLDRFLSELEQLILRGARQFKFLDRTFNLSPSVCTRILQFFLNQIAALKVRDPKDGLFLHFEMVPDRLPAVLRELIKKFPPGSLQFEIGIQTWNPEVSALVSRRQDYTKIVENFRFLTEETGVHLHADLIAGLPGETLESFAKGFDAVSALNPQEIQLGLLKRLRGTPIIRHDQIWEMIYQEAPPYQVLQTKTLSFEKLQKLSRFQVFWDLFANSGNFPTTLKLLKQAAANRPEPSLFWQFYEFVEFLAQRHPQARGTALLNLVESAWVYLTTELQTPPLAAQEALIADYSLGKTRRDIPAFLRHSNPRCENPPSTSEKLKTTPRRQARHLNEERG